MRGGAVDCTPAEFKILERLTAQPGRAFTRQRLLEDAFGFDHYALDRTVDVHIRHLRKKLGVHADVYIETVFGVGHRFQPYGAAMRLQPPSPMEQPALAAMSA